MNCWHMNSITRPCLILNFCHSLVVAHVASIFITCISLMNDPFQTFVYEKLLKKEEDLSFHKNGVKKMTRAYVSGCKLIKHGKERQER